MCQTRHLAAILAANNAPSPAIWPPMCEGQILKDGHHKPDKLGRPANHPTEPVSGPPGRSFKGHVPALGSMHANDRSRDRNRSVDGLVGLGRQPVDRRSVGCLKTQPIRQTVAVAIAAGLYNRAIAQRSTASLDYGATTRRT